MKLFKLKAAYSDVDYVEGVVEKDKRRNRELFLHCKKYFDEHYHGVFFTADENKDDIFQNTYVTFWENIERGKIYVEDGILKGKGGKPFTGSLTTYMMGIAKLKYREWVREKTKTKNDIDINRFGHIPDIMNDGAENDMLDIIAECIAHMSERCSQILTLFWYNNFSLSRIMEEIPSYKSVDALKTEKYKCMKTLKLTANDMYQMYING